MYTYIFILCFAIFLLVQQSEKKNSWLNYILLFVEAVFLIFSKNNSDYANYLMIYNGELELPFEVGIKYMSNLLRGIGLESYTYFLIFVMILIAFVFWKWGKIIPYINHVLFLYALMIMYYDCIQIRNTIATFMVLYALYLSLYDKNIQAIGICLIAVFFHRLAFLMAVILICVMVFKPKNYEISILEIGLHVFVGLFVILFGKRILLFLASKSILFVKIYDYLSVSTDLSSLIIWAGSTAFMMVLLWYFGVKNTLAIDNTNVPEIRKKQSITFLDIVYLVLAVLVFCFFSMSLIELIDYLILCFLWYLVWSNLRCHGNLDVLFL